jgi:hypothetical protein
MSRRLTVEHKENMSLLDLFRTGYHQRACGWQAAIAERRAPWEAASVRKRRRGEDANDDCDEVEQQEVQWDQQPEKF